VKFDKKTLSKMVWFLDYDGSMCPHQEVWEERSYASKDILNVLSVIASMSHSLIWNTGRKVESLSSVDKNYLNYSGYFVQGSIYWDALAQLEFQIGPPLESSIKVDLLNFFRDKDHFRVEIKPTSARVAPVDLKWLDELRELVEKKMAPLTHAEWEWVTGTRGVELLAKGFNKKTAIERELLKVGASKIPIALGDDVFDRPAIEAALAAGGYGVLVGEGCGWITEVPHKPDRVMFFENPHRFHEWVLSL
jgi:trehalose-6-phosphatase